MIRRLLILVGVLTALAAGVLLASDYRQFGLVGEWRSIGLRQGKLFYIWRPEPLADAPGWYVDDASAVNRAMYSIGQGVKWTTIYAWFWTLLVASAVGYSLVLPAVLRRWRPPTAPWLRPALILVCFLLAALWTASRLATTTYEGSHVHIRLEDGSGTLFVDRNGAFRSLPSYGSGWNVYRPFPPLRLGMPGYFNFWNGRFALRIPLGETLLFLTITTIVFLSRENLTRPGLCINCSYDLCRNTSGRCPECGTVYETKPDAPDSLRTEG